MNEQNNPFVEENNIIPMPYVYKDKVAMLAATINHNLTVPEIHRLYKMLEKTLVEEYGQIP